MGILGAILSDFVLVGAAAIGLGALLAASEFWFSVVKWVGAAYLAFLGVQMLRSRGTLRLPDADAQAPRTASPRALFMKSFLVAVTNPKGYLFVSAFLPQFVNPAEPQAMQYLTLAIAFALIDALVIAGYALAGMRAASLLREKGAIWLDRICGGALITLAASLALYRRAAS